MTTSGREAGPGGPSAFVDSGGALRLAYHAWTAGQVGYPGGARRLHLASNPRLPLPRWSARQQNCGSDSLETVLTPAQPEPRREAGSEQQKRPRAAQ